MNDEIYRTPRSEISVEKEEVSYSTSKIVKVDKVLFKLYAFCCFISLALSIIGLAISEKSCHRYTMSFRECIFMGFDISGYVTLGLYLFIFGMFMMPFVFFLLKLIGAIGYAVFKR